ncbi:hypothetical protein HFO10_31980 [Rhizobium laguerreae]|uniref:hypothetical protein n=1 Tax=Rhizobium laguerreae TaxID=1076926 RepID=UPI001C90709D|nr:hypothetical protein [Rhizobium laguerreae]MBY3300464.1 hypothetical protein [Rhizobium laguerreae]
MRKIEKPDISPTDPRILRGKELAANLEAAFKGGVLNPKTANHYATFKDALKKSHKNKCCYCEASLDRQHGDVEHFRPKQRVTDEHHKTQRVRIGEEEINHPGYFWLAYDLDNLLLSCAICNQPSRDDDSDSICKGAKGKWNRFPLDHPERRACLMNGYTIEDEEPKLMHPLFDNIAEHLVLGEDGRLGSKTKKGEMTICILGLNSANLISWRLKASREGFEILPRLLRNVVDNKVLDVREDKKIIWKIMHEEEEFSMAYWLGLSAALMNIRKESGAWVDGWLDSIVADVEATFGT